MRSSSSIKMIIAPIIFCTVVVRHRRHGGHEGRQDRRPRLCLFRGRQHVALLIGLIIVNVVQPAPA